VSDIIATCISVWMWASVVSVGAFFIWDLVKWMKEGSQ